MSSLQDSLNRFKQQQEKCQTTLKSIPRIAPSVSSNPRSPPQPLKETNIPTRATPAKPAASSVKFSDDAKRLQYINNIRNSPVGAQMKDVIKLLYKTRDSLTAEQICDACHVDVKGNQEVFNSLRKNIKVHFDGKRFSYKAKHAIGRKDELLYLIRSNVEGLPVVDIKDAYDGVLDDLQALKADDLVWVQSNTNSQEDVVYPNDPKTMLKSDDDIRELFRSIELPRDMVDIEKELQKNRHKPATNTAQRRAAAQVLPGVVVSMPKGKKNRGITKRTKLTNAHLPELFENL